MESKEVSQERTNQDLGTDSESLSGLDYGCVLDAAVKKFKAEKNENNFRVVLRILADSLVWIPCTAILSKVDRQRLDELVQECEGDAQKIENLRYYTLEQTRFVPNLLGNGDKDYVPVFTNPDSMGAFGNRVSKLQKHMLEVISFAQKDDRDIAGIVLNAFSEPFVLDKEIWDAVLKMKNGSDLQ